MVGTQTRVEVVEEMAPAENQSSVALWAPKANPRAPKANPLCVLLCLFAGLAPKANQTH